jgi:hypothetical protein
MESYPTFHNEVGVPIVRIGCREFEEMPRKSAAELEAECLRLLAMDPHTRGIKRVEIIRMYPKGTGPNWTYGALDPMPTRAGVAIAQTLIASVYGRWALAD